MLFKPLVALLGSFGAIAPLFYISRNHLKFNSEKTSINVEQNSQHQMIWDCQRQNFENLDLSYVTLDPLFFELIHCYKENQYDWQIALPKFIFDQYKLDSSKTFELISEEREDNVNAIKVAKKKTSTFNDWLLIRKINSHNIFTNIETKIGYSNLFEFEIISSSKIVGKAWVIL